MIPFLNNIPLSDYCTYRSGGPAKQFLKPKNQQELTDAFRFAHQNNIPCLILGKGSNVLISDKGFDGLVIYTGDTLNEIRFNGNTVTAECGVLLHDLVAACVDKGLAGIEDLTLIPGTVGGAVRMNAGAFQQSFADHVFSVLSLTPDGKKMERTKAELCFGYRTSCFVKSPELILSATLDLVPGDRAALLQRVAEDQTKRKAKQPWDSACCGSVFKRPAGRFAGPLIEQCGLKGCRIGKAMVSPLHANFIVNEGGASSADIRNLIFHVQQTVQEKTGVLLEPEVLFIGEF
ncbi:MAG: UDP-N-acetylenolpyruvoylglucosamine reductase [Elusimicrobia bacterium RIFOXYB2_FULL_49_7]|nr:MAG: UDP-N-acetylenolpyruvoylglucosamine reductase [Elusimicrobia bacterium RIFOXYB2_FULL_49_7]